jgi:hypothetical protein
LHKDLDILYTHAKFCGKPTFFMFYVKRQKKMSCAKPFLAPNFILFTHNTKNTIHRILRSTAKFLFGFLFEILNFFKIDFEKPGAYGPGCQHMTLIHFTLFCLKMGNYPGLCIEQMHTTSIYVIYSTKINKKKACINYTNWSHQTKVLKHYQTNTTLEG